jgi:hypothetical protein
MMGAHRLLLENSPIRLSEALRHFGMKIAHMSRVVNFLVGLCPDSRPKA